MCEFVYSNGRKCRLKPLEGSKYCPLHVPYDEGERIAGDEIRNIKEETFRRRIREGQTYYEGVYLYSATVEDLKAAKPLVFKNSHVRELIVINPDLPSITLYGTTVERLIIVGGVVNTIFIKNSRVFGLSLVNVNFRESLHIRDSTVRYLMITGVQYRGEREKEAETGSEEEYGERGPIKGKLEISNLREVRRIGINSDYPLVRRILQENNLKGIRRRSVRVGQLVMRNVEFDTAPRFRRQVRVSVSDFSGILTMENMDIFGHVEISNSRIRLPEFVHVRIRSNLAIRSSHLHSDRVWNMTVLPNLPLELTVEGFMIIENCTFSTPGMEELFYRLARTSWEKSGDFERADQYYYLEMLARRKVKTLVKRKGVRRIAQLVELGFEWLFADVICKYGTDWKRPILIWLIAVNVIFPVLFYATHSVSGVGGTIKNLLEAEYFSVVTATTLGYGDYHPVGIGRVFASIEALFGMFMWAVFLTVFARKYMR
ncbi:MAG: two pore domain potassium channel family protein [Thermococci archaeon]|nr:two pore domain potassium channel family protein [Thermococci archaeon]